MKKYWKSFSLLLAGILLCSALFSCADDASVWLDEDDDEIEENDKNDDQNNSENDDKGNRPQGTPLLSPGALYTELLGDSDVTVIQTVSDGNRTTTMTIKRDGNVVYGTRKTAALTQSSLPTTHESYFLMDQDLYLNYDSDTKTWQKDSAKGNTWEGTLQAQQLNEYLKESRYEKSGERYVFTAEAAKEFAGGDESVTNVEGSFFVEGNSYVILVVVSVGSVQNTFRFEIRFEENTLTPPQVN